MANQNKTWEEYYEKAWRLRHEQIENYIAEGTKDPYILIQRLSRFEEKHRMEMKLNQDGSGEIRFAREETQTSPEQVFPTGKPFLRAIPFQESLIQIPYYRTPIDFLLDFVEDKNFEAIVELGSGFGQNLIELHYRGGPRNIPYYAGERTESGTELAKRLSTLNPNLNLIPFHFDYKNPDLSIVREKKRVFIFTAHSIEQVTTIPSTLFSYLSSIAEEVICIHFEPFGYQISIDENSQGELSRTQTQLCKTYGWNQNLAPCLFEAHSKDEIEITYLSKNALGEQVQNPTSIAIWKSKVRRES